MRVNWGTLTVLLGLILCCAQNVCAQRHTTITFVDQSSEGDLRGAYEKELLTLALDLTEREFGTYTLIPAPQGITNSRARENMKKERYHNFIRGFAYRHSLSKDPNMRFIDFPIYLGLLSYRVCFTSEKVAPELAQVVNFRDLLKYSHVQGVGWLDNRILRRAGFSVVEVANYEALFEIAGINRANLFCRGLNEYLTELKTHQDVKGLVLDESFALYYPFPVYFHAHVKDVELLNRVELGLAEAYQNGSMMDLWERHFLEGITYAQLSKRKVFKLENHMLKGVDNYHEQFFFRPQGVTFIPTR